MGLSFNNQFRIKFNHYDNGSIPNDGFAFDDISIQLPATQTQTPTLTLTPIMVFTNTPTQTKTPIPSQTENPISADLNEDGNIDQNDLKALIENFFEETDIYDLDGDGVFDYKDLFFFSSQWKP